MQYPQIVLLHKQQKGPRAFLAILKYVAAQQPTDRQFSYSNRPIRCSTQLSRYYGRYHEHAYPNDAAGRGAAVRENLLLRDCVGTTLGYTIFCVDAHVVVD